MLTMKAAAGLREPSTTQNRPRAALAQRGKLVLAGTTTERQLIRGAGNENVWPGRRNDRNFAKRCWAGCCHATSRTCGRVVTQHDCVAAIENQMEEVWGLASEPARGHASPHYYRL